MSIVFLSFAKVLLTVSPALIMWALACYCLEEAQ